MKAQAGVTQPVHYLLPGQWYVGRGNRRLRTLLGSCVSVTLWHPRRLVGAMCHYMLPGVGREAEDARYARSALYALTSTLHSHGCEVSECAARLFGGGGLQKQATSAVGNVGGRNVEEAWRLVDDYGLRVEGYDLGGPFYRRLEMNLVTGVVDVLRQRWSGALAASEDVP